MKANAHQQHRPFIKKIRDLIIKIFSERSLLFRYSFLFSMGLTSIIRLKRRKLLKFEVHATDHCNLNCKGCEHFSSVANVKFLDINIFERDCVRLSELTNKKIEELGIVGGEPLLHPEITKIFDIARKYFPLDRILILTNGLLLLKVEDNFWENCRKNNIIVTITKYPIKLDFQAIENKAQCHNVKMEYMGSTGAIIKTMRINPLDLEGKQNIKKSFKYCYMSNYCIHLLDGKLYTCPRVPNISYFNNFFNQKLQITEKDYIDIFRVNDLTEIFDYLCHPIPFCRYCNTTKVIHGTEWAVSKKNIKEWTI
ncbi:hypothetical protein FACS1894147_11970 [Spirochaetia bacterium]|nr:hypothetical protein FACS1894147_11970 [Spirochaetia bacterium]